MNKIVSVIKLMAQTGLFFANVDGQYDSKEKEFIENFVASIEQVGDLEPELKADVTGSLRSIGGCSLLGSRLLATSHLLEYLSGHSLLKDF